MARSLARLAITVLSGWSFGSFRFGVFYPVASHLMYGITGGLLVLGIQRWPKGSNS